jgi:MFS family permease
MRYIRDTERKYTGLDLSGMALLGLLLVLITYGATDIAGSGMDLFNLSLIALGLLMLIPFVMIERRVKSPIMNLQAFRVRVLSYSLIASFTQALGYLSVVFLLIMYLQGIRGYNPLQASLILVPGYVLASLLAPRMGRFSDRFGPHIVASAGIVMMAVAVVVYTTLTAVTDVLLVIIPASLVSGIGGAMFWPANNSAVMSSAPQSLYGSVSGLLRTLSSIGTLLSYVLSISIASVSVPRYVAFEVFLGTGTLRGGISGTFLQGIHTAFFASFALLILAGIFSYFRGTHGGGKALLSPQPVVEGGNK